MPRFLEPIQHLHPSDDLPWHQHAGAYVAIVLEGGYMEAGDDGRRRVLAGDAVIHQPYCGHLNRFARRGAVVINFALSHAQVNELSSGRCTDPEVLCAALKGQPDNRSLLLKQAITPTAGEDDLPDLLAAALSAEPGTRLDAWAAEHGVPERTLRRQFALAYGMPAASYRARARARNAWGVIASSDRSLVDISYALGFADQAHLSRAIRKLSAMSPKVVRAVAD